MSAVYDFVRESQATITWTHLSERDNVGSRFRENYIHTYINAYVIHPLFLEFLAAKQGLLSEEQKRETYAIAGDWCNRNGFTGFADIFLLFHSNAIGILRLCSLAS